MSPRLQSGQRLIGSAPTTRRSIVLSTLTAELGAPTKSFHLHARGDCVATDQYLWSDGSTEFLLVIAGTGDSQEMSFLETDA